MTASENKKLEVEKHYGLTRSHLALCCCCHGFHDSFSSLRSSLIRLLLDWTFMYSSLRISSAGRSLVMEANGACLRAMCGKLSLLCGEMHRHPENYLSIAKTLRKMSKVSVSTCTLTVEVMISPGPSADINPISSMVVEMCSFSSDSHLYMFHWTWTKLKFQHHLLVRSRLVIHLWASSVQDSFPLARCNLGLFSLAVSDGLRLAFLDGNPDSFSQFFCQFSHKHGFLFQPICFCSLL